MKEHGRVTTSPTEENEGQATAEAEAGAEETVVGGAAMIVIDLGGPETEVQVGRVQTEEMCH
jgi:hypothetical protein